MDRMSQISQVGPIYSHGFLRADTYPYCKEAEMASWERLNTLQLALKMELEPQVKECVWFQETGESKELIFP